MDILPIIFLIAGVAITGIILTGIEKKINQEEARNFYIVLVTLVGFLFVALIFDIQLNLQAQLTMNAGNTAAQLNDLITPLSHLFVNITLYFGVLLLISGIFRFLTSPKINSKNHILPTAWVYWLRTVSWGLLVTAIIYEILYIALYLV